MTGLSFKRLSFIGGVLGLTLVMSGCGDQKQGSSKANIPKPKVLTIDETEQVQAKRSSRIRDDFDIETAEALYASGKGRSALLIFSALAEEGNLQAVERLTAILSKPNGQFRNLPEAIKWLSRGEATNDAICQFRLGWIHATGGKVVEKNPAEAVKWLRKSADQDFAEAQLWLSKMYASGEGVNKDLVEAYKWIQLAALNGSKKTEAQEKAILSEMTIDQAIQAELLVSDHVALKIPNNRLEVARWSIERGDVARAFRIYQEQAKAGDAQAQGELALMYLAGLGVEANIPEAIKLLLQGAAKGNPFCQYQLAVRYARGEGVESNDAEALTWLRKSAEQAQPEGQLALALRYRDGVGVETDLAEAFRWARLASSNGNQESRKLEQELKSSLTPEQISAAEKHIADSKKPGATLIKGKIKRAREIPMDLAGVFKEYQEIANAGDARAQHDLGLIYALGRGTDTNLVEAVKWFRTGAEKGDAPCQLRLALCFLNGEGVERDPGQAVQWLLKSAEQKERAAQLRLSLQYYKGEGIEKDLLQAYKWIRLYALQRGRNITKLEEAITGEMSAQQVIDGDRLVQQSRTDPVSQKAPADEFEVAMALTERGNHAGAFKHFLKLARAGHLGAQHQLGVSYFLGRGTATNHVEAVHWFRQAADQNYADSQYALGMRYSRGEGLAADGPEAIKWLRKAADQGVVAAQAKLASMYRHGTEVPRDMFEAYKWIAVAAKTGRADVEMIRSEIVPSLTSEQIAQGDQWATEYMSQVAKATTTGAAKQTPANP